jgi:predicted metal-dependent peptidase
MTEERMPESNCPLVERIARVLAGAKLSANADGDNGHAAAEVDRTWREHVNQALAVLHTAREPDEAMAAVGNAEMWRNMVEAAIAQRVD